MSSSKQRLGHVRVSTRIGAVIRLASSTGGSAMEVFEASSSLNRGSDSIQSGLRRFLAFLRGHTSEVPFASTELAALSAERGDDNADDDSIEVFG